MTTARQELYDLADNAVDQESSKSQENLTKEDVSSAIDSYFTQQQQALQEAESQERRRQENIKQQQAEQELREVSEQVKTSLQEEMKKDQSFAKLVQETDLPGKIIDYIAEVGEADEAPLIIRELAQNDQFQQKLKNTRTALGVKRLMSQVRKNVLLGGRQTIPPMLERNIPQYNVNTAPNGYEKSYISDVATRHGI